MWRKEYKNELLEHSRLYERKQKYKRTVQLLMLKTGINTKNAIECEMKKEGESSI